MYRTLCRSTGDGFTTSSLATVSIAVLPITSDIAAGDDEIPTAAGAPVTLAAPGILANDAGGAAPLSATLAAGANFLGPTRRS